MTERFDDLLGLDGPVALVITERLQPVTGPGGVFFPPTFAPPEEKRDERPQYLVSGGTCLVDTVGAQANRIEPIFQTKYRDLVPQVTVKIADREVNLVEMGHRAADAMIRFSTLGPDVENAFRSYRADGNAEALARFAPTTLVFGAWDSRGSQAKLPRIVESTIRAYGVNKLERAAQYFSAIEEDEREQFEITADALGDKKFPAEEGLVDNPGRSPGGITAEKIQRDAVLNLVALRSLSSGDAESTRKLQRYVLGLSLVAFFAPCDLYLRQGCLLTGDPLEPGKVQLIHRDGKRADWSAPFADVENFARSAAEAFGPRQARAGEFQPDKVKAAAKAKAEKKPAAKKAGKS